MRSLSAKLLLWSIGILGVSFAAFVAISFSISTQVFEGQDLIGALTRMQAHGALNAYRQGGALQLKGYLALLDRYLQLRAEHYLVDENSRDVLTGADMSVLLQEAKLSQRLLAPFRARIVIALPLPDQKFQFILVTQPPISFKDFLPYKHFYPGGQGERGEGRWQEGNRAEDTGQAGRLLVGKEPGNALPAPCVGRARVDAVEPGHTSNGPPCWPAAGSPVRT
jgi:hypothetical protein